MMVTFSEGLLLSEKVGLDPNVLVEVIPQIMIFYFIFLGGLKAECSLSTNSTGHNCWLSIF